MSISDPYFSTARGVKRLLEQYELHKNIIIAVDFDDTLYDYHKKGFRFPKVLSLLLKCQKLGFTIILFSTKEDDDELVSNIKECEKMGLRIKWTNSGPVMPRAKKPFFNIYLDDKSGLKQAFDILSRAVKEIEKNLRGKNK